MGMLKDLLYNKGNKNLEIGRVMFAVSVFLFWGAVFYAIYKGDPFDPLAVGGGVAAIFTGAAGVLFVRQKHEDGGDGA